VMRAAGGMMVSGPAVAPFPAGMCHGATGEPPVPAAQAPVCSGTCPAAEWMVRGPAEPAQISGGMAQEPEPVLRRSPVLARLLVAL